MGAKRLWRHQNKLLRGLKDSGGPKINYGSIHKPSKIQILNIKKDEQNIQNQDELHNAV